MVLSFIICSRNDSYMGDPMWRLSTAINYLSRQVHLLKRETQIEILVADWGSEERIDRVAELTEESTSITKFLYVPKEEADRLQKDSPFAEVFPLNAAARRANGQYIGRIDQDTLVTKEFIEHFFLHYEGKDYGFDLRDSYLFVSRKQVPYSFTQKHPSLGDLEQFIYIYGSWSYSEEQKFCHWASPVGILMMHKDMWYDVGGYDERLIYYWYMDIDLAARLLSKYPIINIGKVYGYHFFHLEHVKPGLKFRFSHRKRNPDWAKSLNKSSLNPNGTNWGLASLDLEESKVMPTKGLEHMEALYLLNRRQEKISLFLFWIATYLRRCVYYQLKFCWYLSKRLMGKPYL